MLEMDMPTAVMLNPLLWCHTQTISPFPIWPTSLQHPHFAMNSTFLALTEFASAFSCDESLKLYVTIFIYFIII